MVTGAIAPARVNGVMTVAWLRAAYSMMPVHIGSSRRNGDDVLMTEYTMVLSSISSSVS